MTEQKGFRSVIEANAIDEADRIITQLNFLRAQASEVLAVMRALNLPTPEALRNLAPIEEVPTVALTEVPVVSPDNPEHPVQTTINEVTGKKKGYKLNRTPSLEEKIQKQKDEAEKKYQVIRGILMEALAKGPRLKTDVINEYLANYTRNSVEQAFTRMRKAGEIDSRTEEYQGPAIWFLPSRPVTIEKVRDASLKVKQQDNNVHPVDVACELSIEVPVAILLMNELVSQGILFHNPDMGWFYEKPTGPPVNRPKVKEELPKVLNGRGKHVSGTGRKNKISSDKEVQQIIAKAESMGAQVKKQGNNHIYVEYGGQHRILSATPGDSNRSNREKLKDLGISV